MPSGSQILCGNLYNTVRINIKRYLYLRHTRRRRFNAPQLEPPKQLVVSCKLTLALQYFDIHRCLEISGSCKHFTEPCRNRGIPVNQLRRNTSYRLNRKRKWCDIHQDNLCRL